MSLHVKLIVYDNLWIVSDGWNYPLDIAEVAIDLLDGGKASKA